MGVSDIFVFVADAIYDYALAADAMEDTDEDGTEGTYLLPYVCTCVVMCSLVWV